MFSIKANAVKDVHTKTLAELILKQNYQYPARVIALKTMTLSSEITGLIQSKPLLVGTAIKNQQILLRLACTDKQLAKQQATAALKRLQIQKELDQQQLSRARKLLRVKSISKQEFDQKQTALDASIAELEQQYIALKILDHNISRCTIKAPLSGIIIENNAQQGAYVSPGLPLITLIDPTAVEIEASLPSGVVKQLTSIKELSFLQGGASYSTIIRAVLPIVDRETMQQTIRLSLSGNAKPFANSIGVLQWEGLQAYISSRYVVQRGGRLGVFIAQDNRAIFHPLKQAIEGQMSPINLSAKTLVIINKLLILNDDDVLD